MPGKVAILGALMLCLGVSACGAPGPDVPSSSAEVAGISVGSTVVAARDDVEVHREVGGNVINHLFSGEEAYVVGMQRDDVGNVWMRVQIGGQFGWVREDPDDPPLTPAKPGCPEGPADRIVGVSELQALSPWERLLCLEGRDVAVSPALVARLPSDLPYGGTPEWLADEPSLHLFGAGGQMSDDGPLAVHVDPASQVRLEEGAWYAVTLEVNALVAPTCVRDLRLEELGIDPVLEQDLAPVLPPDGVLWCRQQLVVTSAVRIPAPPPVAEPQAPPAGGGWGPLPEAPIAPRGENGSVWTGEELIVWGGLATDDEAIAFQPAADGAAFDPVTTTWRTLADGPLEGRVAPTMVWTGSEVVVLGGLDADLAPAREVAAYDPAADRWRELPPMPDGLAGTVSAAWTGDELLIVAPDGESMAAFDLQGTPGRSSPLPTFPPTSTRSARCGQVTSSSSWRTRTACRFVRPGPRGTR